MKHTSGLWDLGEWPIYFIAADVQSIVLGARHHRHVLVAVNEIRGPVELEAVRGMVARGNKILLDSGVFWLAGQHAIKHGMALDQAIGLAPDQLDGFQPIFDRYVQLATDLGPALWGCIEIDLGGKDNKIKTRAKLENMGLAPMPVYHPRNDGWDYFDELASGYDRICLGNTAAADMATRKRLVATVHERRKGYPGLWIHVLGLSPAEMLSAYPLSSCDSSGWIKPVQWGLHHGVVANKKAFTLDRALLYDQKSEADSPTGHYRGRELCGYEAHIASRTMQVMTRAQERILGVNSATYTEDISLRGN